MIICKNGTELFNSSKAREIMCSFIQLQKTLFWQLNGLKSLHNPSPLKHLRNKMKTPQITVTKIINSLVVNSKVKIKHFSPNLLRFSHKHVLRINCVCLNYSLWRWSWFFFHLIFFFTCKNGRTYLLETPRPICCCWFTNNLWTINLEKKLATTTFSVAFSVAMVEKKFD